MDKEIVLKNNTGKQVKYHILFSFEKDNYIYIAYTDYVCEEDGNMRIYYGKYNNQNKSKIEELDSQEDIDFMMDITKEVLEGVKQRIT